MVNNDSHLFGLPTTGLRFFRVHGLWSRPDMALFKFTKKTLEGSRIPVFKHGNHTRDFICVADIVEGAIRSSEQIAQPNSAWDGNHPYPATSNAHFRIFNIGNNNHVKRSAYLEAIEAALDKKPLKTCCPKRQATCLTPLPTLASLKKPQVINLRRRSHRA